MTSVVALAAVLAGGTGAVARYLLESWLSSRRWGLVVVNTLGSGVLGLVVGLAADGHLPPGWTAVAGVGLLGGFTTLSGASLVAALMLHERRTAGAVIFGIGSVVLAVVAAGLGLAAGTG